MISVQHLDKFLGGKQLLDDVNFRLGPGEKAAIVGANGTGKSTLLRICAGVLTPDSGEVSLPNDANVGYLPQHADLEGAGTVYEALRWVFREVDSHFEEMDRLAHRMAEVDPASDEYEKIADRYGHLQHEIDRLDAYEIDPQIDQVMTGLGFTLDDRDRDCSKLSGGWQMRVILGRVLLSHPDVLLLDEPTNHLDLETMIWLENWIRDSQASVLMISHERKFMDALAERVFELHDGIFTIYRGNYTEYLAAREERWAQWEREYENQQIEIDRLEKFIGRFRYNASKAQLVQSRIKQLDKIERIAQPPRVRKSIHFRFPQPERANKEVVTAERLSKSFGAHEVLHRIDFTLWRGEKVALVGLNGAGKSTLLKILAGRLDPDDGRLDYGPKTSIEYFAQYDKDGMSEKNSVWQEMASAAPPGMAEQARDLLGGFSFSGEDVEKSVSVLSGGERTRVRLAKMLFSGSNLLLLDEPTNHLDIDSRKTLERALTDYEGTVVLVSHDRVFLDAVATRVCEIKDGGIRSFPGNYSEYAAALERLGEISQLVDQRSRGRAPAPTRAEPANVGVTELVDGASSDGAAARADGSSASSNGSGRSGEADGSMDATPRPSAKELSRERRRLEKRVEELEREIASIERRQNEINEELLRPAVYSDPRRARPFQLEQDELRDRHAACLREWESCGEQLESLPRL